MASQVTQERRAEFERLLVTITRWVEGHADIRAVGLAGSWARERAWMGSNVDLVVLTNCMDIYVTSAIWIDEATDGQARIMRTRKWGPLTERRVRLPSGLEIEFGFAPTSWADIVPVDAGTASVISDGFRIVYDPDGLLTRLVDAVRRQARA